MISTLLNLVKSWLRETHKKKTIQFEIKNAILHKEFKPYYQPIVDVKNKKIIGYEALARWIRKDDVISPDKFIGYVEQFRLMEEFTNLVIQNVVQDLCEFQDDAWISINIIAEHLESDILVDQLTKLNWPTPKRIKFELTENNQITNKNKAKEIINTLKNRGYGFKLDDYGSGFGNAKSILELGFTEIKIDRAFIGDTSVPSCQNKILLSLIKFSKGCGVDVIAEGVETITQAKFLVKNGIFIHQGYLYSKPASINEIVDYKLS